MIFLGAWTAAAAVVVVKARAWATALMARVAWRVRSIAEVEELGAWWEVGGDGQWADEPESRGL